jgi:NAD(P)-dependent dehydrogenase (short-subunit alcohol dehydrogenase family)
MAHRHGTLDFDNLQFEKGGFSTMKAYGRSKLTQILFAHELARRLAGTGVSVNSLHPGAVATRIWSHAREALPTLFREIPSVRLASIEGRPRQYAWPETVFGKEAEVIALTN